MTPSEIRAARVLDFVGVGERESVQAFVHERLHEGAMKVLLPDILARLFACCRSRSRCGLLAMR